MLNRAFVKLRDAAGSRMLALSETSTTTAESV
jgi:hypothetical protein